MAHLIPFNKQFSSSAELVTLLRSRGMYIEEERKAEDYLDNIGYYRLSAYMYPLLKTPKTAHVFKNDATFTKVMMLYRFDNNGTECFVQTVPCIRARRSESRV